MKKILFVAVAAIALTGCSEYSRSDRAVGGAVIGAGTGAVIGGLASDSTGGAVVGGLAGGAVGAIVGAETTPHACIMRDYRGRVVRDYYGRPRRVQCP